MAQEQRGSRSGEQRRGSGDRSRSGKPSSASGGARAGSSRGGKPSGEGGYKGRSASGDGPKRYSKDGKPSADRAKRYSKDGKPADATKRYSKDGKPSGPRREGDRDVARKRAMSKGTGQARPAFRRTERVEEAPRTEDQKIYDGPPIPEGVTGKELDRAIAAQLRGLPEKLAMRIAMHLVAAQMFIDDDPERAYLHAKAAKARTQRLAVIREALGEAAYAAGHYAEALSELRAAKRMNGATAYLPIMADCHRALGQPEDAVRLARSSSVANFVPEAKAEMTIVEAGARRDMGHIDAALRVLELAPLNSRSRASWVVRLRYAYADALEAAGRDQDALAWFHRTQGIDHDEITDSAARAEALEKKVR